MLLPTFMELEGACMERLEAPSEIFSGVMLKMNSGVTATALEPAAEMEPLS
ncbi:Uncharacterised protein [uncultured archaeon]|nr:Uncharacterised protein [uncultured archaeon]